MKRRSKKTKLKRGTSSSSLLYQVLVALLIASTFTILLQHEFGKQHNTDQVQKLDLMGQTQAKEPSSAATQPRLRSQPGWNTALSPKIKDKASYVEVPGAFSKPNGYVKNQAQDLRMNDKHGNFNFMLLDNDTLYPKPQQKEDNIEKHDDALRSSTSTNGHQDIGAVPLRVQQHQKASNSNAAAAEPPPPRRGGGGGGGRGAQEGEDGRGGGGRGGRGAAGGGGGGGRPPRALIFTMDSITSYVEGSRKGGPAGEILIRTALEHGLRELGFAVDTATSDAEFDRLGKQRDDYSVLIVDPWTYAKKGWVPKTPLVGREKDVYVLSFFGTQGLKNLKIDLRTQVLTAFPTAPHNDFIGYFYTDNSLVARAAAVGKKPQGVLWGKNAKYLKGKEAVIRAVANLCELHTTIPEKDLPAGLRGALVVHQHLDPNGWHSLLAESKFLLGLEDPLLGPSAVDAVSNGCMFINPVYSKPKLDFYTSQHPYIADTVGEPYVCNTRLQEISSVEKCVQKALGSSLKPFIPKDLAKEQYLIRLRNIFGKYLM